MKNVILILLGLVILLAAAWSYFPQTDSQPEKVGTLSIPEMGITIPLQNDIRDLVYHSRSDGDLGTIAVFSTQTLAAKGERCTVDQAPLGIVYISTSPQPHPAAGSQIASSGGKYAYYIHPQEPCSEETAVQTLQGEELTALQNSLRNMKF